MRAMTQEEEAKEVLVTLLMAWDEFQQHRRMFFGWARGGRTEAADVSTWLRLASRGKYTEQEIQAHAEAISKARRLA
jgi:hypothetical protein